MHLEEEAFLGEQAVANQLQLALQIRVLGAAGERGDAVGGFADPKRGHATDFDIAHFAAAAI
ncbi:MAG: hypothetical protein ABI629_24280 [bacterium]